MKKRLFITAPLLLLLNLYAVAQDYILPSADIQDLQGGSINSTDFENDGKPIVISFWATWCKPCINELNTIAEDYEDWVDETGVKIIAISTDDARNVAKVKPFVDGKGWEYEVYVDPNGDLKRALSVNFIPHTFLLNDKKEIVWQHQGYNSGDEEELLDLIRKVANGESVGGH